VRTCCFSDAQVDEAVRVAHLERVTLAAEVGFHAEDPLVVFGEPGEFVAVGVAAGQSHRIISFHLAARAASMVT
jgi:hypothetical protein